MIFARKFKTFVFIFDVLYFQLFDLCLRSVKFLFVFWMFSLWFFTHLFAFFVHMVPRSALLFILLHPFYRAILLLQVFLQFLHLFLTLSSIPFQLQNVIFESFGYPVNFVFNVVELGFNGWGGMLLMGRGQSFYWFLNLIQTLFNSLNHKSN